MFSRVIAGVGVVLFVAGSLFLISREISGVYLKSGIKLYKDHHPEAVGILQKAVSLNRSDYLSRVYLAKALSYQAFNNLRDVNSRALLYKARGQLEAALRIRVDSFDYLILASVYEALGDRSNSIAYYNISFFLSQNVDELERWPAYKEKTADTSMQFFKQGEYGTALAMAYNSLSNYQPFWKQNEAGDFIAEVMRSVSPSKWFRQADSGSWNASLKELFAKRSEAERSAILTQLNSSGLGYLSEVLGDS